MFDSYVSLVQNRLERILKDDTSGAVLDAMSYSLIDGGKRLRPVLLLATLDAFGVNLDQGIDAACALEMVHTYSLVHDDLPCMDDDAMRRFKPTVHIKFDEATAVLSGDALLTRSFKTISDSKISDHKKVQCISVLASMAGINGMIRGQELDVEDAISSLEDLTRVYELKTGCLFATAFEMAVIIAEREHLRPQAQKLGYKLGVAFQFQDDLLENTSTAEQIGKSTSSDSDRNKTTICEFETLDRAHEIVNTLYSEINDIINTFDLHEEKILLIINTMLKRKL